MIGFMDYLTFFHKGFISRKIPEEYSPVLDQPWINMNCSDERFSFKIHELDLGTYATYWQGAVHKKDVKFKGFYNLFKKENLRGVLSVTGKSKGLGLIIRSGRIQEIKPVLNPLRNMEELVGIMSHMKKIS
jgi:hypothetical protein